MVIGKLQFDITCLYPIMPVVMYLKDVIGSSGSDGEVNYK
jgi:hypothetical protein